jgi:hypothetical protein
MNSQLLTADEFTCKLFVMTNLRRISRYPQQNEEFRGGGGGVPPIIRGSKAAVLWGHRTAGFIAS